MRRLFTFDQLSNLKGYSLFHGEGYILIHPLTTYDRMEKDLVKYSIDTLEGVQILSSPLVQMYQFMFHGGNQSGSLLGSKPLEEEIIEFLVEATKHWKASVRTIDVSMVESYLGDWYLQFDEYLGDFSRFATEGIGDDLGSP